MHPALYLAVRSTRRRPQTPRPHAGSRRSGHRHAAIAGTIAVIAAGGLIADTRASASTPPSAALSSHAIGIGGAGSIVAPGRFGWQRHCPTTE